MAEEAQRRVETALSNFVDEVEKTHLRQMQVINRDSQIFLCNKVT